MSKDDDSTESDTEFVRVPLQRNQPRRDFGFTIGIPLGDAFAPSPFDQDPFFRTSPWGGIRPQAAEGGRPDDFMTQLQGVFNFYNQFLSLDV